MKRLSSKIMTMVLSTSLVISLIGCATTQPKVEEVPETTTVTTAPVEMVPVKEAEVVEAAPAEKVEQPVEEVKQPVEEAAPAKKVEQPVEKEVQPVVEKAMPSLEAKKSAIYPYGIKTIVKSDQAVDSFDLYIAATGNINGALDGIDYAQYATMLKAGRNMTSNTLLIDAGNATSGTPEVELFGGQPAVILLNALGYDAVIPGTKDFFYGSKLVAQEAAYAYQQTNLKILSANVLTSDQYPVFQPYQVYYYNGKTVLVTGLTSPMAQQYDTYGLKFTDPIILENAQKAIDYAKTVADYIVVVGNTDDSMYSAKVILNNVKGIDLFINASEKPYTDTINGTTVVGTGSGFKNVSLIDVTVKNGAITSTTPLTISSSDIKDPQHSKLAQAYGVTSIERDSSIAQFLSQVQTAYDQVIAEEKAQLKPKTQVTVNVKTKATVTKKAEPVEEPKAEEPKAEPVKEMKAKPAEEPKTEPAKEMKAKPVMYPLGVKPIVKSNDGQKSFDLYIVHTNDVNGALSEDEDSIGYAKLATMVKTGRQLTDKIMLLDAGNVASGSDAVDEMNGLPSGMLLDMLGYDAVSPAEGDFVYGAQALQQAQSYAQDKSSVKIVSANLFNKKGNTVFTPYQIYDFDGFKVAVTGLTPAVASDKLDGLKVLNPLSDVKTSQAIINEAKKFADYVVVIGNSCNSPITSEDICKSISGIDLFVDGQTSTGMSNGEMVNGTLIVRSGAELSSVGVVDVTVKNCMVAEQNDYQIGAHDVLDPAHSKMAKMYGITAVPADHKVASYVSSVNDQVAAQLQAKHEAALKKVVARLPYPIVANKDMIGTSDTNLTKYVCKTLTQASHADFTIINTDCLGTGLAQGDVTVGMVNHVIPANNAIMTATLTGAEVLAALENGYSALPASSSRFAHTDLKVVFNKYAHPGKRVMFAMIGNKMIDKSATYTVCTTDTLVGGYDGYTQFTKVTADKGSMRGALTSALMADFPAK